MAYILIVDDDEDFADTVATVLSNAGYETCVEIDPENVLAKMREKKPDLLVLDVMFPEDNSAGFKLAQKIRQQDEVFRNIPLIMLTAVHSKYPFGFSKKDIDNSFLPIEVFIEKPVNLSALCKKVDELLNR